MFNKYLNLNLYIHCSQARQTRPNSGGGLQRTIQDSTKGGLQYFFTFYALKIELFRVFTQSD